MWENYLKIPNWVSISRDDVNRVILNLRLPKGSKTLDIGCGFGRISIFLNSRGYNVTAIDNYPKMVRLIRSKGIKAEHMDASKLRFKNRSFDLVFSDGLLEHFKDEEKIRSIIREQLRVSKNYVINFIPSDTLANVILEKVQRVPKEYRGRDWIRLHKESFPQGKNYRIAKKKLSRLDAYIVRKG